MGKCARPRFRVTGKNEKGEFYGVYSERNHTFAEPTRLETLFDPKYGPIIILDGLTRIICKRGRFGRVGWNFFGFYSIFMSTFTHGEKDYAPEKSNWTREKGRRHNFGKSLPLSLITSLML